MAMNYAWQERKKFAIPVAAGAAVLLVWYLFVLSPLNRKADGDVALRKSAQEQLRIRMLSGVPDEAVVARAFSDQKTYQRDLNAIRDDLEFRPDDAFRVKEGQTTTGKFGRERQAVFSKIDAMGKQKGYAQVDNNLGFPKTFGDLSAPVLTEWLIRLAVVQRICTLAMDSGVVDIKLLEVVPADQQEDPTIPADRFLGVLLVKFKVTGSAESIIRLGHGLQQKGKDYLAIEAADITSVTTTQNTLGGVFTVGAMVVRPEGSLTTEEKR
jgi:hypothetical protein